MTVFNDCHTKYWGRLQIFWDFCSMFYFQFLMYRQWIYELCRLKLIYRISHRDRSLQTHIWIKTKISAALYAYIVRQQDARKRRRKKTKFMCIRAASNTFHTIAGVGNDKIVTRFCELTMVFEKRDENEVIVA